MTDADVFDAAGVGDIVAIAFVIIGVCYGLQVLRPLPKTYLSEITFPFDFCVKLVSSLVLVSVHTLHWIIDMVLGGSWHQRPPHRHDAAVRPSATHVLARMLASLVAGGLLWMEHRRSRSPSVLLRAFWMFTWVHVTIELFAHERVNQLDLGAPSTLVVTMAALAYLSAAILGASCFFRSTPVHLDYIDIPLLTTPTAYLHSATFKFPLSNYGTLGNYEVRSSHTMLQKHSAAVEQHPDATTHSALSRASTHSVSRGGAITVSIPAATTSIWGKNHFISYKVVVRTEDDRWTLRRQYSDFATLHDELPADVRDACCLPEDASERKYLSWKRRPTPMKTKLEMYLQSVLNNKTFEPYSSQALCDFLEMEYVDENLFQSAYSHPLTGSSDFGLGAHDSRERL